MDSNAQIKGPVLPAGLDTPALVIDLDIVERNAARMAGALHERGISVRPHVKTHKSVGIARIQLDAGATGITVGTIGEAEVMADAGITDIFIAYPVWADAPKAARIRALHERPDVRLTVGTDSIAGAQRLAAAVDGIQRPLRVLIELDPGQHRTGLRPEHASEVATAAKGLGLDFAGLFTHGGHSYAGPDAKAAAAADEVAALTAGCESLRAAGMEPQVLSAGSSPTALAAAKSPVTQMRPGTYIVADRQQVAMGSSPADGVAIAVVATVVSTAVEGQVVINAGTKTLTKDVPSYIRGHGLLAGYPDGVVERVSDYHGVVLFPDGAPRPAQGEIVAVIPNHACPVIDLFDSFVATRSGEMVGVWPVDARGKSG